MAIDGAIESLRLLVEAHCGIAENGRLRLRLVALRFPFGAQAEAVRFPRPIIMPPDYPAETEVTGAALAFANALARGEWSAAHAMLAPRLRDDWQPIDLQRRYGEMTSYWEKPATSVEIGIADSERAYIAIYSLSASYGVVQEAVDVRVVQEHGHWLIDDIVWGRP